MEPTVESHVYYVEQDLLTIPKQLSSPPVLADSCYAIFTVCIRFEMIDSRTVHVRKHKFQFYFKYISNRNL
jgi:hypothetical protein